MNVAVEQEKQVDRFLPNHPFFRKPIGISALLVLFLMIHMVIPNLTQADSAFRIEEESGFTQHVEHKLGIGAGIEIGKPVSGPVAGALVGLEVFGNVSEGETEFSTRLFWIEGQMIFPKTEDAGYDTSTPPYYDLTIRPVAFVEPFFGGTAQTDFLPIRIQRDDALGMDRAYRIHVIHSSFDGRVDFNGKKKKKYLFAFGNIAANVLGLTYFAKPSEGVRSNNFSLVELSGELGVGVQLDKKISVRLSVGGELPLLRAGRVHINSHDDSEHFGGPSWHKGGSGMDEFYQEISVNWKTILADFSLFGSHSRESYRAKWIEYSSGHEGDDVITSTMKTSSDYFKFGLRIRFGKLRRPDNL